VKFYYFIYLFKVVNRTYYKKRLRDSIPIQISCQIEAIYELGFYQETRSCLGAKVYARDRTVYLYANRRVASTWDYQISITVKPIKFQIGSINSLGLIYIIKVLLFFSYVSHEPRYLYNKSAFIFFLRAPRAEILQRKVQIQIKSWLRNVVVARGEEWGWCPFPVFDARGACGW